MKIYLPEGLLEYFIHKCYEDKELCDIIDENPNSNKYPLRDSLKHPIKMLYPVHVIMKYWLYSDFKRHKKTKIPKCGIYSSQMMKIMTGRLLQNIKLLEKYDILEISSSYLPASIANGNARPKTYKLLHPWHTKKLIEYNIEDKFENGDLPDEYSIFMKECLSKLKFNINEVEVIKKYLSDKYGFKTFKSNDIVSLKEEFKLSLHNTKFKNELWVYKLFALLEDFDNNRMNISNNSGRLYSKISNLPHQMREYLEFDGEKLMCIDCANSQPLLLNTIIDCGDYYKKLCEDGTLYEHIDKDREKAKELFIKKFMFAKRHYFESSAEPIKEIFPDIYEKVKAISLKNKNLALQLQRIESEIWIKNISYELFKSGIEHITLHDSVYVNKENFKQTKKIILKIYENYNLKPKLNIE